MNTRSRNPGWVTALAVIVGCAATAFGCSQAKAQAVTYQTTQETTRVEVSPGRFESQWVPPEYGTALDAAGRPYGYVVRPGYTRQVWIEPVYEYRTQTVTVAVPCPPPVQTVYVAPAYCPPVVQTVYAVPAYCPPTRPVAYCPPPPRPVVYCPPPAPRSSLSVSVNIGGGSGFSHGHGRPVHHARRPAPAPVCVTPVRPTRHSPSYYTRSHHRGNDRSGFSADVRVSARSR